MKRIFSFLFAIITLVGTTGVFTSCQEDAPEINYTINITVNNDFTEVVNAINNGTMKQEAAIAALTAAINQMNGNQAAKLQALIEAINTLATTLDAKLAIIEAAMKAQTLALETKLGLLAAAVDAQTLKQEEMAEQLATAIDNLSDDIAANLEAIKTIIKDSNTAIADKLALIEGAMKAQTLILEQKLALIEAAIKALPDYSDEINALKDAIVDGFSSLKAIIESTSVSLAEKLAAIETGMKAQTLSLEQKFDLLVLAVNNQTIKQEEMGKLLATAIDNLGGTLEEKLAAIEAIIESTSATLAEKIAAVEAAMKAQTLALENKLALLDAAIKALPDYTDQLKAIEAAIKALPDYSTKLAAIETAIKNIPDYSEKMAAIEAAIKNAPDYTTALEDIKDAIAALPNYTERLGAIVTAIENLPNYGDQLTAIKDAIPTIPNYEDQLTALETALEAIAANIKAQEGQYADELAALTDAIDDITAAVAAGNKSQEDALAEIIALLESGALAGGGSGSNDKPYITLIATEGEAPVSFFIPQSEENELELEGATIVGEIYHGTGLNTVLENSLKDYTDFKYSQVNIKVTSADKKVKVYGKFTTFIPGVGYTSVDTKNNKDLKELVLSLSTFLESLTVADDGALTYIDVTQTELTGTNATAFMESLPTRAETDNAILYVEDSSTNDNPEFTDADKSIATEKNWKVSKSYEDPVYNNWISIWCGDRDKIMYAYLRSPEWFTAEKGYQPREIVTSIEGVSDRYNGVEYKKYSLQQFYDDTPMLLKGDFTLFVSVNTPMTHLDASNQKVLKELTLKGNSSLSDFKIASDGALEYLDIRGTDIKGDVLNTVISSLPDRTGKVNGVLYADGLTDTQKTTATSKNWKINP